MPGRYAPVPGWLSSFRHATTGCTGFRPDGGISASPCRRPRSVSAMRISLEIASLRRQLGALLGVGDRLVDLLVRYGHAAPMPRSLRRPVREVIIAA